jgi:hypothetical protein
MLVRGDELIFQGKNGAEVIVKSLDHEESFEGISYEEISRKMFCEIKYYDHLIAVSVEEEFVFLNPADSGPRRRVPKKVLNNHPVISDFSPVVRSRGPPM